MFADNFTIQDDSDFKDITQPSNFYESSTPDNESKYIEQFLQQGVLEAQTLTASNSESRLNKIDSNEQDTTGLSPKNSFRHKSKFHNYQKHLIITLRKTVKIQKIQDQNSSNVVKELWKSFCSSRIYNKSLLRILFGEQMMEEQLNMGLFKKEGFRPIIQKYTGEEIIQAQRVLRRAVLAHFQESSLDNLLNTRKLPAETKELFKKYIVEFVGELKEGNVMKRLPKSRKRQILTMG